MSPIVYEYERYVTDEAHLKETVAKYGVAIIPGVLDEAECTEMQNGMWDTMATWTEKWEQPISRDKPESWRGMRDLFPMHSMLIQLWGLGHAPFIWNLRQNPKVAGTFAKFWDCKSPEDLLVSFDGGSFHLPSEVTNLGWYKHHWYHADQSYTKPDFECIQSWVTGFDVNEGDATLAFFEGSHLHHADFGKHYGITKKDNWYKLQTEEEVRFYADRGCVERRIKCPKGSMVFWDSRTIHCGVEPLKTRLKPNFRCVAYLCYMPRSMATEKDLAKKIEVFEAGRMTTHWPIKAKMFQKTPHTYGKEIKPMTALPKPTIGPLGRRLIGYSGPRDAGARDAGALDTWIVTKPTIDEEEDEKEGLKRQRSV